MTKTATASKSAEATKGVSLDKTPAAATDKPATAGQPAPDGDKPADAPADKPAEGAAPAAEVVDIFANLPIIKVGDDDGVLDLTGVENHADPRKYGKVHADATEHKLPIQRGWKHSDAMFVTGHNKGGENGFRPGSVYGTIADIVRRTGKSGVSAQELVTAVRKAQIGNKRSVYCNGLPPVGWVEGWLNSAVRKNIVGIHASKKAPALTVADVAAKDTEATAAQQEEAKKTATA